MAQTKYRRVFVSDIVGMQEIAARAGVTTQAVVNWRHRHEDFPTPLSNLASGPVFNWPEIAKWLTKTGRSL